MWYANSSLLITLLVQKYFYLFLFNILFCRAVLCWTIFLQIKQKRLEQMMCLLPGWLLVTKISSLKDQNLLNSCLRPLQKITWKSGFLEVKYKEGVARDFAQNCNRHNHV